jgi:hypothetical protein
MKNIKTYIAESQSDTAGHAWIVMPGLLEFNSSMGSIVITVIFRT